jgi:zinc-ribbon domain
MFCPRCGAEVEEGARYCASCGNELPQKVDDDAAPHSDDDRPRGGLRGLIGEDRRSRVVTLLTVVALLAAIVAFIALKPSSDESTVPQDALTRELDALCVQHKLEIAKAQNRALREKGADGVERYAEAIVPIVGSWRTELSRASVPGERLELVDALKSALLETQIQAGTLARAAHESDRRELARAAAQVDGATKRAEAAIHELELQRCGDLTIAGGRLVRQ